MRILLFLPLAVMPLACTSYAHEIDLEVANPRGVWVVSPKTGEPVEPPADGRETRIPGTRDVVERTSSGALRIDGNVVVGRDGVVTPPESVDETTRDGDTLHTTVCVASRRRHAPPCARKLVLGTKIDNVRGLYEEDAPQSIVGWLELLGGAGLAGTGGYLTASDPTTGGGKLLIGTGAIAALIGVIQLMQAPKNERVLIDPDDPQRMP